MERFLPVLADTVRNRRRKHLASLVATGVCQPVCLLADKATHQKWTRQLVGGITLNPGGPELLCPVFLGAPVCSRGDGDYLTKNIAGVADQFLQASQIASFTGDGVYQHCKVGEKLNDHYKINCHYTWDQMHLAATVGSALQNPKRYHAPEFVISNHFREGEGRPSVRCEHREGEGQKS